MQIAESAPFSSAFREKVGWKWASGVVGAGASIGIVASLLVAMLGQARYLCVIARARLVHPSTGTPMNATVFLGNFLSVVRQKIISLARYGGLEIISTD